MRLIVCLSPLPLIVLLALPGFAQCTKDTDCKGDRICQDGGCVDPGAVAPPQVAQTIPQSDTPCARIACSGRGTCIVRDGAPVCACLSGYLPDDTGVNCVLNRHGSVAAQPVYRPSCVGDSECDPGQVCRFGKCLAREGNSATTAQLPDTAYLNGGRASKGWALFAGILGFTGGAAVLGLSIASAESAADAHQMYDRDACQLDGYCSGAAHKEEKSWAYGVPALATAAVLGPVVYFGGASARTHPAADGAPALRVIGWAAYGASITCALGMVAVGLADERVPPALIGFMGGLGTAGIASFSIDALVSRSDAKGIIEVHARKQTRLTPLIAPLVFEDGTTGIALGLGGHL